jgi:tetratricopeptide (TPR) repeat protein
MPGRNETCPCGSGLKYKHCCAQRDRLSGIENARAEIQLKRGLKLEREGHFTEAAELYRLAATSAGAAPEANSRLGHLFLAAGRAAEAVGALRLAATTAPENTERRLDLVRALLLEKNNDDAETEVRRALAGDPGSADGYWLLGRILAESGRFAEARAAFVQSIALDPRQGAVYYDLSNSYTLSEDDRPLIAQMLSATRSADRTDRRVRLHFALGKAFDDLEEYGPAMQHFARANLLKRTMCPFDREEFAGRVDALIEKFTPAFLASHMGEGEKSELPILVLGMPRSGTTLVEQILSSHPDVVGAGELQFWPECERRFEILSASTPVADLQRGAARDCLATLRSIASLAGRVVDKNPFNYLRVGLIHLIFPQCKIIHCRRSPLDTCLSIHKTYFRATPEFSTDQDDLVFYYDRYMKLMDHWRAVLPPGRLTELDYEELVADPEPVTRRLVAACGLPWNEACLQPERNGRILRTASKWQARQAITKGSIGRWRRYEPWIAKLRELEPATIAITETGRAAC